MLIHFYNMIDSSMLIKNLKPIGSEVIMDLGF